VSRYKKPDLRNQDEDEGEGNDLQFSSPNITKMASIAPFKIGIPEEELSLLQQKLKLARIAPSYTDWRDENGLDSTFIRNIVDYWRTEYDWRSEEAEINKIPQFMTQIEVSDGFGSLDVHFAHSQSSKQDAVPLIFIHGWPGSFIEVSKGLKRLNDEGFHVVAPSLPGYGFSGYPKKKGFDLRKVAEVLQKLMLRLGYEKFLVQGGDWGSHISRCIGILYPENTLAIHTNMFEMPGSPFDPDEQPEVNGFEKAALERHFTWFRQTNHGYGAIQGQRPATLGFAMHDSPVGMLAWMYDKLVVWSDEYPWTPKEIITWTLMHYFPGPTTGFMMYHENTYEGLMKSKWFNEYIKVPYGISAFPRELAVMPRSWAQKQVNLKFYRQHPRGGHFAMHEKTEELVSDLIEFYRSVLGR